MAAADADNVLQPQAVPFYPLQLARAPTLKSRVRLFLLLLLLFISADMHHVQQSKCYRGPLASVWWRLRNEARLENLWSRTLTYIAPAALDSDWVYQQMNFCPLGMYAFLRWTESLRYEDQLYAWHVLTGTNGVRRFLAKFHKTETLVGRCDPEETFRHLKETLDAMAHGLVTELELRQLHAIATFRKAFFNTASSICNAINRYDSAELKRILFRIIPLMRQCVAGLLQLTTEPSTSKLAAARSTMARWIRKLFRLDFAFLCLCPNVPSPLLEDYLNLGRGLIPSEVVVITILKNIPQKWRSDEFLKVAIPAATLRLDGND